MAKIANDLTELIGKTPLVRLNKLSNKYNAEIIGKLESFNPCSSVKDRIAYSMIEDAEKRGVLKPGGTIIEATSGNTGIGMAWIAAVKGYKVILTMPETMSKERKSLLKIFGAKIVLTEGDKGMRGAIEEAERINKEIEGSIILQQFSNPANPEIHRKTTAEEIWSDTDGKVDIFISGVGTGGTITGVGEALKAKRREIKIIAVEPEDSPVLSGGNPGHHMIQGIGAGFIPDVLNRDIVDEIIKVSNQDAFETTKNLATDEGLLLGISSGAAVRGAIEIAKRDENKGKQIVVILPDTGERYLSLNSLFKDD
ncbi:MAG: cysteine synthase A [Nitrospinota bacterium]|nr:cysteine synthase A [Nitrospinota bacterium]